MHAAGSPSSDKCKAAAALRELNSADMLRNEKAGDGLETAEEIMRFSFSPPMTVQKYVTMQQKRVEVRISYAGFAQYATYCNAAESFLKSGWPDVLIKRVILPAGSAKRLEPMRIEVMGVETLGQALQLALE